MRILGFDWDATNLRKLAEHDLDADSVEELFSASDVVVVPHPSVRTRRVALGFVSDGRFVVVVFEPEGETRWVRVVTAYESASSRWWREYERYQRTRSS